MSNSSTKTERANLIPTPAQSLQPKAVAARKNPVAQPAPVADPVMKMVEDYRDIQNKITLSMRSWHQSRMLIDYDTSSQVMRTRSFCRMESYYVIKTETPVPKVGILREMPTDEQLNGKKNLRTAMKDLKHEESKEVDALVKLRRSQLTIKSGSEQSDEVVISQTVTGVYSVMLEEVQSNAEWLVLVDRETRC